MNVQIIYTSLTGSTRHLATAIYEGLKVEEKSIHDLKDGVPTLDGDVILFGYWGANALPDEKMTELLHSVKGKAVGVFATLGYYADSFHAFDTAKTGVDYLKEENLILGSYVCNGAISPSLMEDHKIPEHPTLQKHLRWEMTESHPTKAECDLAVERFNERIHMYERGKALGIDLSSIL